MLTPTRNLLELSKGKEVHYTFFVDVGYLVEAAKYAELQDELTQVKEQIKEMISLGHDVQLHIHPHWEKSKWKNGQWHFATDTHYKLCDFPLDESNALIKKYKTHLENLIGRKVQAYRAGGWCIQPFDQVRKVFEETGIKIDSTVIPGDFLETNSYAVDFRDAPVKSKYRFSDNVLIEDENGPFIEYPIGSLRYSPLFYWRLYILGRIFPKRHKMVGDGQFLCQGGRKKRKLTKYTIGHISSDGYYASKLDAGLNKHLNLRFEDLVIIGHPKGNTRFSIEKLGNFIEKNHNKHQFISFQQVL